MSRWSQVAMVAVLVARGREVRAGDPPEPEAVAKTHLDLATTAYREGDYETASRELEAAYASDPNPNWLYAWAQARRLGGHCADAIPLYERYIATGPNQDNLAAARSGISLCEQTTAAPPSPPAGTLSLSQSPSVVADRRVSPRQWYDDRLADAFAIGGTVTTGVGITFLALSKRSEDAAHRAEFRDDFGELLDQATLRRRIGFACLGAGATLAIVAFARYAMHRDAPAGISLRATSSSIAVLARF